MTLLLLAESAGAPQAPLHPEDGRDQDVSLEADLAREWPAETAVREPGDQAELVAATHPALGGDEEDGRQEECGAQSHQLHRDTETVLSSGRELLTRNLSQRVCSRDTSTLDTIRQLTTPAIRTAPCPRSAPTS